MVPWVGFWYGSVVQGCIHTFLLCDPASMCCLPIIPSWILFVFLRVSFFFSLQPSGLLLRQLCTMIVQGRSPNLLGSPDRPTGCILSISIVIGLHDQWVYPSLSKSPVKMDLDDDDDDIL